jgi:anaerobic nitric oxide reductase flavorubredoxin
MKKLVKDNVYFVGKTDWELTKFHGDDFSVESGSSQNSYLIQEGKTVLVDTVWVPHAEEFVANLEKEVGLKSIDYIIANHGECDHSGALPLLMSKIPNTPIYCTQNAVKSLTGQYHHPEWDFHVVHTGDKLDIGNGKELLFIEMTMLHWPDSMATFMTGSNILFSMDVFGQHYAVQELFNDCSDKDVLWAEAIKYYANILNPFSMFCHKKIAELKAFNLPIEMIAPSHGAIWRKDPMQIVEKYDEWSNDYQEDQICVIYDTMWHGTEQLAHRIADEISAASPSTKVKILCIATVDKNDIMTEVFKSRAIAVGSPTVVNNVLSSVGGWLTFIKELKFKNKKAAAFGCYGWSGESPKIIRENLTAAGFTVIEPEVKCNWNPKDADFDSCKALALELAKK